MQKKIVLVDGNNFLFRAYYATAYTGNLMKNSKGQVTNALYGFANMINKIIKEENPIYMLVAFDKGKSFRHEEYKDYKAGRASTPEELISQMAPARDLLDAMGIKHFEIDNYEADDIIGTIANMCDCDSDTWDALLVTSDHDYLQLITNDVHVKLLQTKGSIYYDPNSFMEVYGIEPKRVVDLKALMGDSSDNIPGVPGIGEKTALKLLHEYESLDNLYEHIDEINGKLHDKLVENKSSAYFSYKLATIYKSVPIPYKLDDFKYNGPTDKLDDYYYNLEFYSLMSNHKKKIDYDEIENNYKILENLEELNKDGLISYYIECDNENYHLANILGMGLYDGVNSYYVSPDKINDVFEYTKESYKYTFDLKKNICLTNNFNTNTIYDLNLAAYLLNKQTKDDLGKVMNDDNVSIPLYNNIIKDKLDIKYIVSLKAKYIYLTHDKYIDDLKAEDMYKLFSETEMPLESVLARMELNGITCKSDILNNMKIEMDKEINLLSKDIYKMAGCEFNISSPRQLGEVLFEKLGLPGGKKSATGYKTGEDVLLKLVDKHPIIESILKYRKLTKLSSTYLDGLQKYIMKDGKIHTIYKQTLTRTGRLSSVDPNLQNIPARDDLGKLVRKAFVPCYDEFLSCDYSQIELRVLAHISKDSGLINAFKNGEDIHARVAADLHNKDIKDVTKLERSLAKAVVFGIVYGITGFGLGENTGMSAKDAKKFIEKYYTLYPGVREYMNLTIKDAYSSGSVRTLFKRKRNIDELFSSNYMVRQSGERMAMNTPIQGTAADILKMAMVEIDKAFIANNIESKMLLQIHDELIFDVKKNEEKKVEDIVTTIMQSIVKLDVPLKVSQDVGTDLYETK